MFINIIFFNGIHETHIPKKLWLGGRPVVEKHFHILFFAVNKIVAHLENKHKQEERDTNSLALIKRGFF